MTYCIGIKLEGGLVGLADGRITSGTQLSSMRKLVFRGPEGGRFMIMTSGLRSVRDKTLAYLDRRIRMREGEPFQTMLDALEAWCGALRAVRAEDGESLEASKLSFNLHAIVGGQMPADEAPQLFLVYPEGNWIACDEHTPYVAIGTTAYGKPILDEALDGRAGLETALKIAFLSFDATRSSAAEVGYPLDVASFSAAERSWRVRRFEYEDLIEQRRWWSEHLAQLIGRLPARPWLNQLVP